MQKVTAWKAMIKNIEKQKDESINQRQKWLEKERENYLNDKRANIDFTGKLLKISQEDPNLWREIKGEMYQKRLIEERNLSPNKAISVASSSNLGLVKSDGQEIDINTQIVLLNQGMKEVMTDLGGQIARDTQSRLLDEENKAATKLQNKYRENKKESKACTLF